MGNIECCGNESEQVDKSTFDVANQSFQMNLMNKFTQAQQHQIFENFENLSKDQQENLLRQAALIDAELVNRLFKKLVTDKGEPKQKKFDSIPAQNIVKADEISTENHEKYLRSGNFLIQTGKVAVVLLASGQDAAQAMKSEGDSKSIFEQLAVSFLESQKLAHEAEENKEDMQLCKFIVMTSPLNNKDVINYFKDNKFFGLAEKQILFAKQQVLPKVDKSGKIVMKGVDSLHLDTNGSGGLFSAIQRNNALKQTLVSTQQIHVLGVANANTKVLDAALLGYAQVQKSYVVSKAFEKTSPTEQSDVFVMVNDLFSCVNTNSDLSEEQREAKTEDDKLKFRLCNMNDMIVCSKYITLLCDKSPELNFAQRVNDDKLAVYDLAQKKETEAPDCNNAYRFEFRLEDFLVKIKKNNEDGVKFFVMITDKPTLKEQIKEAVENDQQKHLVDDQIEQIN